MRTAKPSVPNQSRRQVLRGLVAISSTVLLLGPTALIAEPPPDRGKGSKGHDKQDKSPKSVPQQPSVTISAGIDAGRARILAIQVGVPMGGYQPLPPGIRKNLARGKPIPKGIARTRLPPSYLDRLPYYPGYEWVAVGVDLLLVSLAAGVIADVLQDVFR